MDRVGVRELRRNLSVYLRRVVAGETLTVTDRGRAVAVMAPLAGHSDPVERLVAQGRLAAPVRPAQGPPEVPPPPTRPLRLPVSQALERQRDDG